MKFAIIFISLCILKSPLYALNNDEAEAFKQTTSPKIRYRPLKDIKWDVLHKYIETGYELGAQQLGIKFDNYLNYQVSANLSVFEENFERCFRGSLKKTIVKCRELKSLLGQFYNYLSYAYKANDAFIRKDAENKDNHGIVDRAQVAKNKSSRDVAFSELQAVTNLLFKGLSDLQLFNFADSRGIIPATDTGMIAFSMDEGGYVPLPILNVNYTQIVNINWGQFDHDLQENYVVTKGTLIQESGFLLEVMAGNRLKVRGYNGDKGEHPFTAHKTTASTWLKSDNKILDIFQGILPFEVINGTRKMRENEGIFVAIPSNQQEWEMLELLFMEGIQAETELSNQAIKAGLIDDCDTGLRRLDEFKNELLSDYEAKIRAEQEERSKLVQEGKIEGRKKQAKKKKGKAKAKAKEKGKVVPSQKATASTNPKNQQYLARTHYEKHRAECRTKYRDLLKILNNIVSEFPEHVKARITTKGSHINVHGEDSGFTIVRPHGGNDDLPPYQVNRIINQLLSFIENQ